MVGILKITIRSPTQCHFLDQLWMESSKLFEFFPFKWPLQHFPIVLETSINCS
jgi:hypothetical protein